VNQQIRFCKSFDGTRIAFALSGKGPTLIQGPYWFGHLEYEFHNPVWRPWIESLSREHTLIRMDERGCGLSDREVADISFDAIVRDLEAVVDAAGFERFVLLRHSQGGAVVLQYAVLHPERVSHVVLFNAYARGWLRRGHPAKVEEYFRARLKLIEAGWEGDEPAYQQLFLSQYLPEASPEDLRSLGELARQSWSAQTVIRLVHCFSSMDISRDLGRISCPVLVLHSRGCVRVPFEEGRYLASLIPNSRLVPLDAANDILLAKEPAFTAFFAELRAFLPRAAPGEGVGRFGQLTSREKDILARMAQGLDNAQIAARLAVSEKTVRNYITHIFDKLGVENRARRSSWRARPGWESPRRSRRCPGTFPRLSRGARPVRGAASRGKMRS
jgi:pimeloyl-ACP methyl ester carboxylesterase/DNA-binding CsgD family transcriptional regulator